MTLAALTWLMGDKVATTSHRQARGGRGEGKKERGEGGGAWAHKRAAHLTAQAECTQTPRAKATSRYMAAAAANDH